jgi:transposase
MAGGTKQEDGERLLVSFELGLEKWKLACAKDLSSPKRVREVAARDLEAVKLEITKARKALGLNGKAKVVSCYEAGRDGFWLHRWLQSQGMENLVVDSASIGVNRRQRRAKTDRIDAHKLVTMLARYVSGERTVWSVVRVPSEAEEDARHAHRGLATLKKERTRQANRIKGLLMSQGLRVPKLGHEQFGQWLDTVVKWDGEPLGAGLKARVCQEHERLMGIIEQIRAVESRQRRQLREAHQEQGEGNAERSAANERSGGLAEEKVLRPAELRGVGVPSAWVLVHEVFAWRTFSNRREVGGFLGYTPTPDESGELSREQGISKAGNPALKALMPELAWAWLQYQPQSALSRWYQRRFAGGGKRMRKVGIVALARKLLIALWRYLEFGVIPDEALLKAVA